MRDNSVNIHECSPISVCIFVVKQKIFIFLFDKDKIIVIGKALEYFHMFLEHFIFVKMDVHIFLQFIVLFMTYYIYMIREHTFTNSRCNKYPQNRIHTRSILPHRTEYISDLFYPIEPNTYQIYFTQQNRMHIRSILPNRTEYISDLFYRISTSKRH